MSSAAAANLTVLDLGPDTANLRDAVWNGLGTEPKTLPAWLFYDAEGSRLFEQICVQPEYYPTRTELKILTEQGRDIAAVLGEGCRLIELGSGANQKARILLRVLRKPDGYVAIDISGEQLHAAVGALAREFPHIEMTGIRADYGEHEDLPLDEERNHARLVGFFPGSTIGNMHPDEAERFLAGWVDTLAGGGMLVGVDLVKDTAILEDAYNDAAGITAAFNRNMLVHINRELGADFEPSRFAHRAFFNAQQSRVEMHLVSSGEQDVNVAGRRFSFRDGESIHTENSYKYGIADFQALARRAGFTPQNVWTDPRQLFSVHFLAA
jgi:dimethylhistidine N-methyltransferase